MHDGIVPGDWRKASITPVFKKGQKYQCSNYRPISLTCVVSKLMENVVCSSIMNHANMHNILYPVQHGFCARRSCETQLIDLVNDIANNIQSGLQTDICVLYFAKDFDKVTHIHLIHKLRWYGITGEVNLSNRYMLSLACSYVHFCVYSSETKTNPNFKPDATK